MVKSNFNETKRAGITLKIHIARIGLLSLPFKTFSKNYPMSYDSLRACLNFAQPHFEGCFRGYFSVVMRSVAGYATNNNRKRDRKEAQKGDDKNLKEENLNRLLIVSRILREFSRIINQIHLSFRQRIQVVFFRYS